MSNLHDLHCYEPSALKADSVKNSTEFTALVKSESKFRQIVSIGQKNVVFGIEGPIILPKGKFWSISAYVEDGIWGKHYILVYPSVKKLIKDGEAFLRLDSGCLSGMVLGDITCDCLQQLRKAQDIALTYGGIIIHIPSHDGRGWQEYKMANQRIMDECNLDTVSTAKKFYGDVGAIDRRSFTEAAIILRAMGFGKDYKFNLGTKNTKKVKDIENLDFRVMAEPIELDKPNNYVVKNLEAKYRFWRFCSNGGEYEKVEKR